jgi:hypothetical protein
VAYRGYRYRLHPWPSYPGGVKFAQVLHEVPAGLVGYVRDHYRADVLARHNCVVHAMNDRTIRDLLFTALILMAAVALYLHLRIHPFLVPAEAHPGQKLFRASFLAGAALSYLWLRQPVEKN